jgi:uncharacterized membrane protein
LNRLGITRRELVLFAVVLAIGAGFRLYHLDTFGLWRDETQTVFLARHTFPGGILQALTSADVSPPLYYFLLHFWERLWPGDWSLRFLSVVIGLAFIPAVYWVGRKLFDPNVALLAAFVAAMSPHHIIVARTVRMYAILSLGALAGLYFTYRFVTRPSDQRPAGPRSAVWWGVVLSFALLMYTHNAGPFFVLAANLFVLLELLWHRETRRLFWPWVGAQLCVVLLYLPELPLLLQQMRLQGAVMGPWHTRYSRLENVLNLFNELTGLAWPADWPVVWMAIIALGTFTLELRRDFAALYLRFSTLLNLALIGFFGPIVLAAVLTPRDIESIPSYVTLVSLPALCFLVARGVNSVRPRLLGLALLVALSALWVKTVSWTYRLRHSNFREIAAFATEHIGPDDVIVIAPDYVATTFNYYFQGEQKQAAFPAALERVEDITWLGWSKRWLNAADYVQPTVDYALAELRPGARLWYIATLGGYPNDPSFSQIRVLKAHFDSLLGDAEVVDSFPRALETAEIYIYSQSPVGAR